MNCDVPAPGRLLAVAIVLMVGGCGAGRSVNLVDASGDAPGPGPRDCMKYKLEKDCVQRGCRWMPGGCGPAPAGHITEFCYAPPLKECLPGGCATGSVCTDVWINPCAGATCTACGGQASYCLPAP